MKRIRSFALISLAMVTLTGCPLDTHLDTRLYVVEAEGGTFEATAEEGVYILTTTGVFDRVPWFTDRPFRIAGSDRLSFFLNQVWPRYFEGQEPAAGLATRSDDGVWSIHTAQVLDAAYDASTNALTWTLRLPGTPDFEPQTGVIVYLDDKGALEEDDDSFVFLHAAAHGEFRHAFREGLGMYRLTLQFSLPEMIVLAVAPEYDAALLTLEHFVDTTWPLDFEQDPPNAAVTIEAADGTLYTTPVTLFAPEWDPESGTLSFLARPLLGLPPHASGPTLLFIDSWEDEEDQTIYQVVVNHEEQYSIWPADRELPLGWSPVGFEGTKQECLDYIEEVWTDMRPLSLRKRMEEQAAQQGQG